MGVQVSLQVSVFITFGYTPRSGTARSYGSSVFNFLRIFHNVFHSGCTNLQSHQPVCKDCLFSTSMSALSLIFLIVAILTSVRQYVISLMTSDIEHLFMFLAFQISSLEKCLFRLRTIILFSYLGGFAIEQYEHLLFGDINPLSDTQFANIFFPFCRLSFHFVDGFLCCEETF